MNSSISPLPPQFNFRQIDILEKTLKANIALGELNSLVLSIPNYEILLHPLTIRESVASSGIENIFTTTLDILRAELFSESNLPKEQKETLNYREALIVGYRSILEKRFLATNQIVEIQSLLEPSQPGVRTQMGTVIKNSLGETVHTPPQNESEIRDLMSNLDKYINDTEDDLDPLIKLAVIHHQFETIHPFYDGNGRTGRIIMILYLVLTKRLKYPILFLSGYILSYRGDYYKYLQEVRENGNWTDWIIYILKTVEYQARETSARIIKIRMLRDHFKQEVMEKHSKIYSSELIDYFFSKAFYTQSDMTKKLDYNRKTSAKYLNTLARTVSYK